MIQVGVNIGGSYLVSLSIISLILLFTFGSGSIYVVSVGQDQAMCPRYGGTLVIGRVGESSTLNPPLTIDDDSFMVANQIFSSLIERAFIDGQLGYKGDLAEAWNI